MSLQLLNIEPLVLVTAPEHPLGHRKHVPVGELRDDTFVTLTRQSALRRHLEDACNAAGFPARISLETSDVHLLSALVARGLGITIVPRSIASVGASRHPLSIIDIKPPITQRCTALAWRTAGPHSPAARAFLATAREALEVGDGNRRDQRQ